MSSLKDCKCILGIVAVSIFVAMAVVGCSDKPENQAEAKLQENTVSVLDKARYGKYADEESSDSKDHLDGVIDELDSAISKNRSAKDAVNSATLAKANLTFTKAQQLHTDLAGYKVPVTKAAKEIVFLNNRVAELSLQKEHLQSLIDVNNETVTKLNELVNGSITGEGIKKTLAAKTQELNGYNSKLGSLEKQKEQLHTQAVKLQKQADDKLLQAQHATGQQKVTLSQAGYDLTSQSNHKLVQVQELSNEVQLIQSKIDVVKPLIDKLENDLSQAQNKITEINNSPDFARLKSQFAKVKQKFDKAKGSVSASVQQLGSAKSQFIAKADEVLEVLALTIEECQKVRSSTLRNFASEKIAVSHYWMAAINTDKVGVVNHYMSILESVKSAAEENGVSNIDRLITSAKDESSTFGKTAFESYDKASEQYEGISGSSDYSCNIKKRHILALYGKLMLAEQLGEYDLSDETAEKIEPLVAEVKEDDPDYPRSLVAKLVEGKSDFVPVLAIDNSEYYEGIRAEFQSHVWPKLPVDQREDAVRELLADLDKLEQEETFDREAFDRILGSEKQRLVTALEKGFEEEEYDDSDPNSF